MSVPPIRRDTRANWDSINPVLANGETAFVTDTGMMKTGDGSTTYKNLNTNYTRNNTVSILDFGAKPDFTGANTGTDCRSAINNACSEVATLNPAYNKTLILPSGNFNNTSDPFFIPGNCTTIQEYGSILTADITDAGPTGTQPYPVPNIFNSADELTTNSCFKTYSEGASRNMEYTGRIVSGLIDRGTHAGNLAGGNGTAMNMFDIRYDSAFIGNKTPVTIDSIDSDQQTLNVSMNERTIEGQPIIFNRYIGTKIIAGRTYYVNGATGPSVEAAFVGRIAGTTLTYESGTIPTIGLVVSGAGVTSLTRIISGTSPSFTVNNSQTVATGTSFTSKLTSRQISVRQTLLTAAIGATDTILNQTGYTFSSLTGYTLSGAGTTTITAINTGTSAFTFSGTTPVVGQPIIFRGTVTRAIEAGQTYFVHSVSGSTIIVRRSRNGSDTVKLAGTLPASVVADLGSIVTASMANNTRNISISTSPSISTISLNTVIVFDVPQMRLFSSNVKYYVITASGSPTNTVTLHLTPNPGIITGIFNADLISDTRANIWVSKNDDFIHAIQGRTILIGREAGGGRIAISGYVQQDAVSSTGSNARNYVGCGGFTTTSTGDGGSGVAIANARGAYFGGNFIAKATGTATNMYNLCGVEVNAENVTGATSRYVSGVASVGAVAQPGSVLTAAYTAGGLTEGGTTHNGWSHGLCFTDLNGRDAMGATGTLIGTYLENNTGFRRTIANVIDVSTFRPTGSVLKTPNLDLTESQLTLGTPQATSISTITTSGQRYTGDTAAVYGATGTNNNTTTLTDASVAMKPKGTGSAILLDSGDVPRLFANSTSGIVLTPRITDTAPTLLDGQLSIRITSGATGMVFTYRAAGTNKTAVIALA